MKSKIFYHKTSFLGLGSKIFLYQFRGHSQNFKILNCKILTSKNRYDFLDHGIYKTRFYGHFINLQPISKQDKHLLKKII